MNTTNFHNPIISCLVNNINKQNFVFFYFFYFYFGPHPFSHPLSQIKIKIKFNEVEKLLEASLSVMVGCL